MGSAIRMTRRSSRVGSPGRGAVRVHKGGDPAGGALPRATDRAAERAWVVLVAHLRALVGIGQLAAPRAPFRAGAARALWSDADPRVRLHADEVVARRELEEPV